MCQRTFTLPVLTLVQVYDSEEFTQDDISHPDRVQMVLKAVANKEVEPAEKAIRAKFFNYPPKVLEGL
jgi:hypothetical protein